ncbi:hypothetical protein BMS3Abin02_00364 [bacterium BMS3Abin02]|nr:hypothetical protein BMS3Abin02_00364 [bacterium BMS3Abin02]
MMIAPQRRICSYAVDATGSPPGGIGAVPAINTLSPTLTARENPYAGSYGEPE